MPSNPKRRATTLSISLTPELASEVSTRVESGLYTSASELFREALRMLLSQERASSPREPGEPETAIRFRRAAALMDAGIEIRKSKARVGGVEGIHDEARRRLDELSRDQEIGPGLRRAPERLRKLQLDADDAG